MQLFTSRNTSVNTWRLPAVYKKLNWNLLWMHSCVPSKYSKPKKPVVLDYGCGKDCTLMRNFVEKQGFKYVGYDKYWYPDVELPKNPAVILCSNVLNVIDSAEERRRIQQLIRNYKVPFFITVYEGDKSYISCMSKQDCWQENKPLEEYVYHFTDAIRNKVLTKEDYLRYIKL